MGNYSKVKKREIDGYVFDSGQEAEYYEYLKNLDEVTDIKVHPEFTLMEPFYIDCGRCGGDGLVPSPKTGKPIKCKICRGIGERKRRGWSYTADFQVWYKSGNVEVVDVKGFANERFPLTRKMFERKNGYELIVVKKKKGDWVRL